MIDQSFASTQKPLGVYESIYPVLTNCWFSLAGTEANHSRQLEYLILTNACSFKSGDVGYWGRNGMTYRYLLFRMQCSFKCGTNDLAYLEQCADFIGNEMVLSEFRSDLPPQVVLNYNVYVKDTRKMMLKRYQGLVERYERVWGDDLNDNFRTNIIERARLTEDERRIIWPDTL